MITDNERLTPFCLCSTFVCSREDNGTRSCHKDVAEELANAQVETDRLIKATQSIIDIHKTIRKSNRIEIGKNLVLLRQLRQYKSWEEFVFLHFKLGRTTANNYIKEFEKAGLFFDT